MNKIKSTLFLAIFVAITATSTLAADGHIVIGGRPAPEPDETTTAIIVAANEPSNEIPFEISKYLWTLVSNIKEFNF